MKVGFIGLGIMGREMAQHIGVKGFELKVWNRSPEILEIFRGKGIDVAASIADLVSTVDVS